MESTYRPISLSAFRAHRQNCAGRESQRGARETPRYSSCQLCPPVTGSTQHQLHPVCIAGVRCPLSHQRRANAHLSTIRNQSIAQPSCCYPGCLGLKPLISRRGPGALPSPPLERYSHSHEQMAPARPADLLPHARPKPVPALLGQDHQCGIDARGSCHLVWRSDPG